MAKDDYVTKIFHEDYDTNALCPWRVRLVFPLTFQLILRYNVVTRTKLGVFYFFLDSFLLVVFCIVLTTNIECEPVLEKGLRDCGLPSNENSRVITMRAPEYDWLCHLHSSYLFTPLFKQRVA